MKVQTLSNYQLSIKTKTKISFFSYDILVCEITNFENGNEPVFKMNENNLMSPTTLKFFDIFLKMHTRFTSHKQLKNAFQSYVGKEFFCFKKNDTCEDDETIEDLMN